MAMRKREAKLDAKFDGLGVCEFAGWVSAAAAVYGAVSSSDGGGGGGSSGGGGGGENPGATQLYTSEANIANRLDQRSQQVFEPLQDKIVADANQAGGIDDQNAAMGTANADTALAADNARRSFLEAARKNGVRTDSGAGAAILGDLATNAAAQSGAAQTAARQTAINTGRALKVQAAGLGAGLDATAAGGYQAAAGGLKSINDTDYARQQNQLYNAGYGVAPIARGISTGIKNMFGSANSALSYAPGGSNYGGIAPNGTWSSDAASAPAADSDPGFYDWKDGGVPSPVHTARRMGCKYRNGGIPKRGYVKGGIIRGPGGPTDDAIPATAGGERPINVSNGEGIMNESAVSDVLGKPLFDVINAIGVAKRAIAEAGA